MCMFSRYLFQLVCFGCGLTSHLAIFQLYSDGRVVHFPNFRDDPTPTRAPVRPKTSLTPLPSKAHIRSGYAGNETWISRSADKSATSTPPRWAILVSDKITSVYCLILEFLGQKSHFPPSSTVYDQQKTK